MDTQNVVTIAVAIAASVGWGMWLRVRHLFKQADAKVTAERERRYGRPV